MPEKNHAIAYVDGSYVKKQNSTGYGIVFMYENEEPVFMYGRCQSSKMRNIKGEIYAAQLATEKALEYGCEHIEIYHDYVGVANWVTGSWKAKKDETKEYRKKMNQYQTMIDIGFCKVKGHSGNEWNEKADLLAKEGATASVKSILANKENSGVPEVLKKNDEKKAQKTKENKTVQLPSEVLTDEFEQKAKDKGILLECAIKIYMFYKKKNHKFKDFKNLKVGGFDHFSKLSEKQLESILLEAKRKEILGKLRNREDYASALKWHLRGLSIDDAIRKANVDREIAENALNAASKK